MASIGSWKLRRQVDCTSKRELVATARAVRGRGRDTDMKDVQKAEKMLTDARQVACDCTEKERELELNGGERENDCHVGSLMRGVNNCDR